LTDSGPQLVICSRGRLPDQGLQLGERHFYSLSAKPRHDQISDQVHLSYVYQQETPEPAITDEQAHPGAAELVLDPDDIYQAWGTYWTRRSWQKGFNTAGTIEIRRPVECIEQRKTLRDDALEQMAKIAD
jgi:hypothetical protein